MFLKDKTYEISPLRILRYLLKHMAPIFWGVSVIPYYMAWVFATRKLYPTYIQDILLSNNASQASFNEFMLFSLGLVVMGPFLGGSTLLYNDYWDSELDRISRRKALFPLPQGLLAPETILYISLILMAFALIFSIFVSPLFLLLVVLCILLSVCYSTPPLRLKNKPGLDVTINVLGSGLFCSIAGWIIAKPFLEYPMIWGFISMFGVASIYIPTTIIDHESDKRYGLRTFAVKLGKKMAFYVGLLCIATANALVIFMALIDYLITREFVIVALPIALVQIISYALILRKLTFKSVSRTIMALASLLVLGNALLLTYYVGLWSI